MKKEVFKLAHEITKRNVFVRDYKKIALKKAWEIVKLSELIIKLSKDFERLGSEKRTNLISIQDYLKKLYNLKNKYHVLNTKEEIFLLNIIYDISTRIYNDNYNDYNSLLANIPTRMTLYRFYK